jgi:ribosomal protein S1
MAKKTTSSSADMANANLTKAPNATEAKFNFTITTEGDTISIEKPALMKKMVEAAVYLETIEDQSGQLILSRKRAKHMRTWEKILRAESEDVILEGLVKRRTKGGFVVDIDGIEAFCPLISLSAEERSSKEKTIKLRVVYTAPLENSLILGSGQLPKAEVKLTASMLNMREIISLHIGQA